MRTAGLTRTAFVGRAEELAAVGSALDAGGCVVAGAAGVGKSRLAAEAVRTRPVRRVLATHSAASVPFGAFAHLIEPGSQRATDVIPAFIQSLRAERSRDVPVVLVDDGHLLDDASAALVLALATTGAARPLVTLRTPEPVSDAIAALWEQHGIERLDIQTLSRLEVGALVRSELDGDVQGRALARIAELSLGNPLYVRELLHDARQTGALAYANGEWRWHEELLAFDRLSVLIKRRTGTIGAAARQALEVVSLVERLPLRVLAALTSEDAVEELERASLVRVASGASADVTIAHPLYGEIVAANLPRTTAIRVRRDTAAALRAAGADALEVAALLVDAGVPEPELFLEASRLALARGGVRFALRLAQAAGDSIEAAQAAAAAFVDLGQFDEVEPTLAPHEQAVAERASLELSVSYVWTRSRALLRGSAPDGHATALLDRAGSWHDGLEWDALMAAERAWAALYDGRLTDALNHIAPYLYDNRVSLRRRFHLCMISMNVHYRLARFDDVLGVRNMIKDLADTMPTVPSEVRVGLLTGKLFPAIHTAQDLSGTEAALLAARARARASGDRTVHSASAQLLGDLALQRGHAAEAIEYLDEAADALGEADALNEALNAVAMHATAHALRGNVDRAVGLVEEMDRLAATQPRTAGKHAVPLETVRALVDGCAGRTSTAVARLFAVADAGLNHTAGEITALYYALRHGGDAQTVASGLRRRLVGTQDPLGHLYLQHAVAISDADGVAQLNVARSFHERGCDLFAAEAATRAARTFTETGRSSLSREAASLAARYLAPCGTVFSWALQIRPDAPTLTSREREIAVLAARGNTNKQIAEELVLSVRTVESHLLNACQKLGVENRRKLADVIDH